MKYIKKYESFDDSLESYDNMNISESIINKLREKGCYIDDVKFGDNYVHFFKDYPYSISYRDNHIHVIVEIGENGITDLLGTFKSNEIDRVVDTIFNYKK